MNQDRWLPLIGLGLLFLAAAFALFRQLPIDDAETALALWTAVLAVATVILAVGTVLLAYFALKADRTSSESAQRQAAAFAEASAVTARSTRAYLVARPDGLLLQERNGNLRQADTRIVVANMGKVPATNVAFAVVQIHSGDRDGTERKPIDFEPFVVNIGNLAPGEEAIMHGRAEIGADVAPRPFNFAAGRIQYFDGFSDARRTTLFCFRYEAPEFKGQLELDGAAASRAPFGNSSD